MNSKLLITAAVAALSLATAAFAGEGGRQPLPFNAALDTGSQQYPAANPALAATGLNNTSLPEYGSQGEVASPNSLPVGAMNGTVQYAEAQHMQRWFAQAAQRSYAAQQLRAAHPNG